MAIALEELKRQRDQIQKHLDWLDAKIAAHAAEPAVSPAAEGSAPAAAAKTSESPAAQSTTAPEAPGLANASVPVESTKEPQHRDRIVPAESSAEPELPTFKAKTAEELQRAKIGCVVLFVGATALFLFLLFGLPYLL